MDVKISNATVIGNYLVDKELCLLFEYTKPCKYKYNGSIYVFNAPLSAVDSLPQQYSIPVTTSIAKYYDMKCTNIKSYDEPIQGILSELNAILEQKCPHLKIKSGHRNVLSNVITTDIASNTGWLLCLYDYRQNPPVCGSSIELTFYQNTMSEIYLGYSSTHETFQRRNYNTLLRCVAILACSVLGAHTLKSTAINAITLYSLMHHFRGKIVLDAYKPLTLTQFEKDGNYLIKPDINYTEARDAFIEAGEQGVRNLKIDVPIPSIEFMFKQFKDIVKTVKCQEGGRKTKGKRRKSIRR